MFQPSNSVADSKAVAARPATTRAAVSNDPRGLRGVDGRSAEARRFRDLVMAFVDDLGGPARASEADKALARAAAGAVVASEKMQSAMINGEPVDLEQASRLQNSASRFLTAMRRRHRHAPKPSTSSLAEHFSRPPVREAAE